MRVPLLLLAGMVVAISSAQSPFKLMGDAAPMDGGCIQLTPDVPYSEGLAYSTQKLNLNTYFEIQFDIYLGTKEEGADGITFVVHNDPNQYQAFGTWGECMGYGRWSKDYVAGNYISPSVAVEFDTYYNARQNDPYCDHAAYLENGTNFHTQYWNNNTDNYNLEDGKLHDFRFRWNPEKQLITVFLDGHIVYSGKKDLIHEVFKGATQVIWGFTASTGRASNLQYFCLKQIAVYKIPSRAVKPVKPAIPNLTLQTAPKMDHNQAAISEVTSVQTPRLDQVPLLR
ncbi:L-type lectin-domain containing protein [Xanthocytophaga agilis]|uniref:L-type lectin-domain containing protein n=1 Tax=Xanthocytophaga agilis TaxID=3048010 RepID=A0AAE3RB45_9BACT|nr:L-type lectin-domain containing protein [Xanthocytophaga agilis]MDJ1504127.1 L-type lectin-domain containing protein [Xanthocytophaga agilis]